MGANYEVGDMKEMSGNKSKQSLSTNIGDLAGQIQNMQVEMREAQAELAEEMLTVANKDGTASVVISGDQRIQSVRLSPELLRSGDPDMVNDILVNAINDAIVQSQALAALRLEKITGGVRSSRL